MTTGNVAISLKNAHNEHAVADAGLLVMTDAHCNLEDNAEALRAGGLSLRGNAPKRTGAYRWRADRACRPKTQDQMVGQ